MENNNRSRQLKFIFLSIVGLLIIVISINRVFGNHHEKSTSKDYTVSTENIIKTTDKSNDYISNSVDDEAKKSQSLDQSKEQKFSNENPYLMLYDEKTYKNVENISKKVATLWINQNTKKTEWQSYVKPSFFDEIKKKIANNDGISRDVKDVIISPVEPNKSDEIKLEAIVLWTISKDKEVISKQTKRIFISLAKESKSDNWFVNRIEDQ